nr:hypothetical protein GCM10025699_11780 [Microbacterium flavescens]
MNPERPWPHLDDLALRTAELGFELRERLTAQPEFVLDAVTWIDPALRPAVERLADPATGLAKDSSDGDAFRLGRSAPSLNDPVEAMIRPLNDRVNANANRAGVRRLAEAAASDPLALDDAEWAALLEATGSDLDALTETADDVRRYTVGEAVTLVVNRNLTSSGLRPAPTDDPTTFTLDDVGAIAADAWDLGATELCVQGLLPGDIDPQAYLDIVRAAKDAAPASTSTRTGRRTCATSPTAARSASTARSRRCARRGSTPSRAPASRC